MAVFSYTTRGDFELIAEIFLFFSDSGLTRTQTPASPGWRPSSTLSSPSRTTTWAPGSGEGTSSSRTQGEATQQLWSWFTDWRKSWSVTITCSSASTALQTTEWAYHSPGGSLFKVYSAGFVCINSVLATVFSLLSSVMAATRRMKAPARR